ncbi:MAG: triose-phosphate isomerase, partial [Candidatus Limiplasma sp.]|nr:triose-phosphate isomerase [Candidatus Limiplasma sp.]
MKHVYLNLKRFDIPAALGGVNRLADVGDWGGEIIRRTQDRLAAYSPDQVEFVMYFPEAHLLNAARARGENSPIQLGCQGVYREDTAIGGNFGAFTTQRTAHAALELGCESVLIGHCEERN